ncbi:MAG: 4-(cytidine 5'-diphospho)-2-C-methyl-D-erythritol kinase, partial [Deltaproteobacteria bacterium]
MSTLVCASHAKLNLSLRILRRRPDGYHDISTVFERISLCDTVRLSTAAGPGIRFRCSSSCVPSDESNLCVKA